MTKFSSNRRILIDNSKPVQWCSVLRAKSALRKKEVSFYELKAFLLIFPQGCDLGDNRKSRHIDNAMTNDQVLQQQTNTY